MAGIPSSLGVGWNAVPGVGSWGVRPTLHSSGGRANCLSLSGVQQDSDLGLRKWSLAPICPQTWQYHLCREYFSSVKRPADPGWLLFCPFWGVVIIPATTVGEWTPASQSQQEEGPKGKLRGRLSWGHSGSSMVGGRAGRRAGRQAGSLGKESLELGKRRGLLQGLLQADPGTSSQVAGGNAETGLAPPLQFSLGHSLPPPTHFRSFGQGSCGWLRSLTQPPWAPRRHRPGKWDRSGWPSTTCQHTWHGTHGCRAGLEAAAAPQSH